jgi:hypothetical protein
VSVEKSIHDKLEQERIAWDYYGRDWMGILRQIRREKDQRRHELLVIDRRKQKLSEWKKRLEQMQYDLTARESRILESEPFLPLARQLQEMKLALEDALPWIETINEVAQIQTMDIKSAGVLVAQELRLNRQFGGIQRQIEIAQGQLKMLNTISAQKEKALSVLAELQNKGVSSDAIYGFSKILDLERMGREWNPLGPRE